MGTAIEPSVFDLQVLKINSDVQAIKVNKNGIKKVLKVTYRQYTYTNVYNTFKVSSKPPVHFCGALLA
jgi:hypothetical protein